MGFQQFPSPASGRDLKAAEEMLPLVYSELHQLAVSKMARDAEGHTLQPTALVHEAWLRLAARGEPQWENRAHFFAAAAEAMRRVLIDHARRKHAARRGQGWQRVNVDDIELPEQAGEETLLAVDESLGELAREDEKAAEVVKLRFFAGLSVQETGNVLGVNERTVRRYWRFARAWLRARFSQGMRPSPADPGLPESG